MVATANAPTGQTYLPMIPAKIEGRVLSICTSMNPGKPAYRPWIGGMWIRTFWFGSASSYPFSRAIRLAAARAPGSSEDISGARERGRIGRILLVTTFDEHHSDVECQCGDDEEDDQPAGEENQDLAALIPRSNDAPNC